MGVSRPPQSTSTCCWTSRTTPSPRIRAMFLTKPRKRIRCTASTCSASLPGRWVDEGQDSGPFVLVHGDMQHFHLIVDEDMSIVSVLAQYPGCRPLPPCQSKLQAHCRSERRGLHIESEMRTHVVNTVMYHYQMSLSSLSDHVRFCQLCLRGFMCKFNYHIINGQLCRMLLANQGFCFHKSSVSKRDFWES